MKASQLAAVAFASLAVGAGAATWTLNTPPEPAEVVVEQAATSPQVTVDNPQGVLSAEDTQRIQDNTQRIPFASSVRHVYYVVFGESDSNVNDTVENFFRDNHPEAIGDKYFADGVLIIGAATDQRQVFAFAGEDVDAQVDIRGRADSIIDAMRPGMRDGNIPGAFHAGATEAADAQRREERILAAAQNDQAGVTALAGGGGFVATAAAGSALLYRRKKRREAIEQGRRDYAQVTGEYGELAGRLDGLNIRAHSLSSAFADATLRNQWSEVQDRFLTLHDTVSGAGGLSSIDMSSDDAVYAHREQLRSAALTVQQTSNAESNINRLFDLERGDAGVRRKAVEDLRADVLAAEAEVKDSYLRGLLRDVRTRLEALATEPTSKDFLDGFITTLGDYRTVLEQVRKEEMSDVKEREELRTPRIYDSDAWYPSFVPYVALSSWHQSNVQAAQAAQAAQSSSTNSSFSSGFSGAGASGGY